MKRDRYYFQREIWHRLSMQGESRRADARREGGEHREERGQASGRARSRNYEKTATSQTYSAVRRHRHRETDIRYFGTVSSRRHNRVVSNRP